MISYNHSNYSDQITPTDNYLFIGHATDMEQNERKRKITPRTTATTKKIAEIFHGRGDWP